MIIPVSSGPSPFASVGSGAPSETSLLMALATMHKAGRIPGTYSDISSTPARKKDRDDG